MIRVIIFIGILFFPLLANAANKSLSNDLAVEAIKIAEKKEGKDIPKELKKIQNLSKKLFFLTAQIIPIGIEIHKANKIDKKAKTMVLGKTSNIISSTSFSLK